MMETNLAIETKISFLIMVLQVIASGVLSHQKRTELVSVFSSFRESIAQKRSAFLFIIVEMYKGINKLIYNYRKQNQQTL